MKRSSLFQGVRLDSGFLSLRAETHKEPVCDANASPGVLWLTRLSNLRGVTNLDVEGDIGC